MHVEVRGGVKSRDLSVHGSRSKHFIMALLGFLDQRMLDFLIWACQRVHTVLRLTPPPLCSDIAVFCFLLHNKGFVVVVVVVVVVSEGGE